MIFSWRNERTKQRSSLSQCTSYEQHSYSIKTTLKRFFTCAKLTISDDQIFRPALVCNYNLKQPLPHISNLPSRHRTFVKRRKNHVTVDHCLLLQLLRWDMICSNWQTTSEKAPTTAVFAAATAAIGPDTNESHSLVLYISKGSVLQNSLWGYGIGVYVTSQILVVLIVCMRWRWTDVIVLYWRSRCDAPVDLWRELTVRARLCDSLAGVLS